MQPRVSIILLNWNGWKDTIECLESLYQITYPNYEIIVVDNDSSDDSVEKIKEYCEGKIEVKSDFFEYDSNNKPLQLFEYTNRESEKINSPESNINKIKPNKKLILIENDKNYGFSEGNNVAVRYSLKTINPDYILFLNNDTVVDNNFLDKMIDAAEKNSKIGIVGPKIYYYDYFGRKDVMWSIGGTVNISRYPGYFDIEETDLDVQNPLPEFDWVSGAAMLVKTREVPIKYLNTEFFFGCEDVDLAIKLKEYGYKIVAVPNSYVWHKVSASKNKKRIRNIIREIKTNLKFLKAHKKHFYLYLPIYIIQLTIWYSTRLLKLL
ncbi:MAG: glycosyltransferase family 2 protein [Methanobacterium sp.]|uniref:glycosyltransferase family 2 protein n=1 Tax=Methanobacterium sp. TaxID=2164 RepID=UPI003D66101A|nr:glycosyltransferase family 2 protein [Methanobacterium sp.]